MKIKPKLTLAFLLAGLVPLVILGVFSYNNAKEGVTNGVLNQLQSVAAIQKHRVESIISQNLERLALVSSRTQLRISLDSYIRENSTADQERMNTILLDARSSIKDFEEIYVLNLDGEVVAATNETVIGSSFANEEAFIRGRAEENSGALLFLDETEELKNYLSGPLYLEDEFIGVVIIKSSTDNILAVLKDYAGLGSTGETLLAERNQEGNALFISPLRFDPQAELHRTMSIDNLDSPTVQALLGNEGILTDAVDYRGEPVLAAVQYIPEVDWGLVTKIDQAEAFAPVALLHNLTVLTIGLAAALVVGVSLYLARSVSKPIQSLAHVTDKIREGDISQRAEVTSNDEVGMLAQHFNEMTEDLVRTNNTLRSTNRALKTLSECNQILVRSTDESTLLKGICRIIVTHGGYCGARVGLVDPDDKVAVRPVAEAWRQNGDCSNHNFAWPEDEGDHAMFMEAVKSDKPLILKDIHIDASCAHLCAEANERGYVSLIALPLSANGQTSGALMIYSAEASPFAEDELRLLTELADDLAYGLRAQRIRHERERTEAALRDSEASLNEAQRIAHIGSWELDLVTNKLTWSDEVYRIFGLEPQQFEATYQAFLDNIHPDDREMVNKAYTESVSNKTPYDIVHRLLLKDGNVRYIYERGKTFYDNGKPVRSIGTVQDITEREQALAKLKESENRYSTLVERGNDGIITIQDGLLKFVNSKMVEMTGFSKDEALGKPFTDFVAPEYREAVIDRYKKRMSGEVTPSNYEIEILAKDARRIPVEISASQIEYGGKPADMAIIRDITERKRAEDALRQSEERYRDLFDNAHDLIQSVSPEGQLLYVNQVWQNALGYSEKEIANLKIEDIIHPSSINHCMEIFQRVLSGEDVGDIESTFVAKDGSLVAVEGNAHCRSVDGRPISTQGIFRDVTARKMAEETLRESEERYRSLVNNVKLGILRSTPGPPGKILAVNPALEEITGYSRDELLAMDMEELYVHCEERQALLAELTLAKGTVSRELHWRKKDGSEIVALDTVMTVRDGGGKVLYFDSIFEDITKRKQAEEALRESEARLNEAQAIAHVGSWDWDVEKNEISFSTEFERLFARPVRDFEAFMDCLHPGDREYVRKSVEEALSGTKPYDIDYRIILPSGAERIIHAQGAVTFDDTSKPVRMVGTAQDFTERKLAESALKASEEKLRLMFKSVPEGITVSDLEGNIRDTNEAAVQMHGYDSKEEMIGKGALELIAEEDHASAIDNLKETLEEGLSPTVEYTFLKKDGSKFPAELSAALLKDGAGNPVGFIAVTRDITERKKMEEQLILTDRLASVGELASGIAHELNNPLTGVIGLSQILTQRDVPEDIKEDLNLVYSEAQRAATIVKNLLTFARKHSPAKDLLNMNDVIGKVLELRAYEQRVSNIEVVTHLAPDLPQIMADYFQLQQVFLNIVINAEHFMIEAHNKGTLTITTERIGDYVRASFTDDGPGIPKENLGHIFDPFFTTKEVGKGTGLGLSICHGIISAHNGQIYAESEPDKGATFVIELPLSQEEQQDEEL